jgi:hypothetical protein
VSCCFECYIFTDTYTEKLSEKLILLINSMEQGLYYCPFALRSSKWLLSFRFQYQNSVCFSCFHISTVIIFGELYKSSSFLQSLLLTLS